MEDLVRKFPTLPVDRVLRFYYGCGQNLQETEERLADHLKWRRENDVDAIHDSVADKPFRLKSFPHYDELVPYNLGLVDCVVDAGAARNGRDIVYLEVLGKAKADSFVDSDDILRKVTRNYIGFFERRSMYLEKLSQMKDSMVRTIQVRDVSRMSLMPVSMAKKVLRMGLDNYPECGSCAVFVNAPNVFESVFNLVKKVLPKQVENKIKFLSGFAVPLDLMKLMRPHSIVALQRLLEGENGDEIASHLHLPNNFERRVEVKVEARGTHYVYFALHKNRTRHIAWYRDEDDKASSRIKATFLTADESDDGSVLVREDDVKGSSYFSLPDGCEEGLFVLSMDNSRGWLASFTFKLTVMGRENLESPLERLQHVVPSRVLEKVPTALIHRFLDASEQQVDKTKESLMEYLQWRETHGLSWNFYESLVAPLEQGRAGRLTCEWISGSQPALICCITEDEDEREDVDEFEDEDEVLDLKPAEDALLFRILETISTVYNDGKLTQKSHLIFTISTSYLRRLVKTIYKPISVHYPGIFGQVFLTGTSESFSRSPCRTIQVFSRFDLEAVKTFIAKGVLPIVVTRCWSIANSADVDPSGRLAIRVPARKIEIFMVALDEKHPRRTWTYVNAASAGKSQIKAILFYRDNDGKLLEEQAASSQVDLPPGVQSALLILQLDHSRSWFQSHEFILEIS